MKSIGIDPEKWVKKGLLKFYITRPALYGLEMHIVLIEDMLNKFQPLNVVMDPISDFIAIGGGSEVKSMLTRLQDMMKARGMTTVYTDLLVGDVSSPRRSEAHISSMIDTWVLLRNIEYNGERNRGMYVLKSRGMAHSNQIREFRLTDHGIELVDAYVGPEGVLTGSARAAQQAHAHASALLRKQDVDRKQRELERRRRLLESQIAALQVEFESEEEEFQRMVSEYEFRETRLAEDRDEMAQRRWADANASGSGTGPAKLRERVMIVKSPNFTFSVTVRPVTSARFTRSQA
jgi:circadian clock protein KaiC